MSFSSGSCGNCYFLGYQPDDSSGIPSGILIDAGVSLRRLKIDMISSGLAYECVNAVLVTHDHLDHIRHLGSYCKRISWPVYCSDELYPALTRHPFTRDYIASCRKHLDPQAWNQIPLTHYNKTLYIRYFEVPHDATQTVGFAIKIDDQFFVLITDSGRVTDESLDLAKMADTVVIESNYDKDLLVHGSYPEDLKLRIMQGNGHLSNDECAAAVRDFMHPSLKNIFLCHLSENNNTPELAFNATAQALEDLNRRETIRLITLPRTSRSAFYIL